MAVASNASVRAVLGQVIKDPDYRAAARIPLIPIRQILLILCAYGGFAFGIIGHLKWGLPLWVCYPVMIYCMFVGFTPLHESTHKAVSSNPLINDILGTISAQTVFPGFNTPTYRMLHLEHHRYAGDRERDPDERLVRWPRWLGPLFLAFIDLHWVHWYLTKGWNRWPKSFRPKFFITLTAIIAIHAIGLASPYWYEFLTLYVIPQRLALIFTGYAFAHIQHPEGYTWEEAPFQSSVRLPGNPLLRALLLGQAEHAVHHLMPHLPWYRYTRVYGLANGLLQRQNIPERGFFLGPKAITADVPDSPQQARITEVRDVGAGIRCYTLAPASAERLAPFDAGAHIEVRLGNGLIRQYSLLNAPGSNNHYEIAVKLDPDGRGGSRAIHQAWASGDLLEISTPRNNFTLYETGRRFVLVAGGIGLTPLLAMAHRLHALGKPFALHICARTSDDIPFGAQIRDWPFADKVEIHLDRPDGRASLEPSHALNAPGDKDLLYICGPSGFMSWVRDSAAGLGWKPEQIHIESFAAPPQDGASNSSFDVELSRSGRTIRVAADMTILDALQHADVAVAFACQQGTCGSCVAQVRAGAVDHRDAYLTETERAEGKLMCLCVSRARGDRLSLDL